MTWLSRFATSGREYQSLRPQIPLALAVIVLVLSVGCHCRETLTGAESLDGAVCDFGIYWPPRDPEENLPASVKPLLRGTLALDAKEPAHGGAELRLVVTVRRPSEEADRKFWNSELAFADIAWMSEVRV